MYFKRHSLQYASDTHHSPLGAAEYLLLHADALRHLLKVRDHGESGDSARTSIPRHRPRPGRVRGRGGAPLGPEGCPDGRCVVEAIPAPAVRHRTRGTVLPGRGSAPSFTLKNEVGHNAPAPKPR
jgi:hypothetical protein